MADVKWIKITTTIFDDEKIKLIDSMPERDAIFYIWIRLLVLAGKNNSDGYIFLAENIPYTDEMLSAIFNRPLNVVRLALETFQRFNMIEIMDNNYIFISNWSKHQSVDELNKIREQTRKRVAKHRAKQKELGEPAKEETCGNVTSNEGSNVSVTLSNAIEEDEEEDREEDKDIDKEEDVDKTKLSVTANKTFSNVIDVFNNNIHMVTPIEYQKLEDWTKDMSPEVIVKAIEEAVYYNKRSMGYINAILNNWLNNNLKTIQSVEAYLRDRADKKGGKPSNGNSEQCINELEDEGLGFTV